MNQQKPWNAWFVPSWIAVLLSAVGLIASSSAEEPLQYNRDIRPILADNCFACHGADSAARKADLRLDQRDAAIDMGAIVPDAADESELYLRLVTDDEELLMPPPETKKKLSPEQIATLQRWIAEGANYEKHWSFIPPQSPATPEVQATDWVKHPLDAFVLSRLEARGLQPAPAADARTLFRRLHLDITGLPPEPQAVDHFAKDYAANADQAVSDWVDRLMQSPAWGEHRARYWLDAARYGDTHGLHFDNYREMWPYRDWVIRAFNTNQPFDEFTIEQIAGDLLPNPTDDQKIATGFQRCNITTNEGGTIDEENLAIYAADRVQTFGWVYLGLTTNCSQCHDHKFDPFTMKDYYSLAAFFRNTTQPAKDGNVKDGRGPSMMVPQQADQSRWKELPQAIRDAQAALAQRKLSARPDFDRWLAAADVETLRKAIPSDRLLVHLPLNEGNTLAIGLSGIGIGVGQAVSVSSGAIRWQDDGKQGPAPQLKPGETIDVGDFGGFETDQQFSYGAWVQVKDTGVNAAILARMDEDQQYRGWDLWQQGRRLGVHIIDAWPNNALKVVTQTDVFETGKWHHVLATYDGSGTPGGIKIYLDGNEVAHGTEQGSLAKEASIRANTHLRVGQRSRSAGFQGAIQDVRIYGRTLNAAEVTTLAQFGPLRSMLETPAEVRTAKENERLYDHYLATNDPAHMELQQRVQDLESERRAIEGRGAVTHIQVEKQDTMPMAYILTRGEYDRPTDQVSASPPEALHPMPEGAPGNRLGLGQWLVDPANPLTARVTVNRFWQQIFGRGIVATPEDFGVMGAPPTHPDLLDWLALDFIHNGWDVKRFFKQIFTSATYRQSALMTPEKQELDRSNAFLSRGPRFRMDAEMVRDTVLSASGLLTSKMYGPSVKPYQPENIWDIVGLPGGDTRNYVQDQGVDLYRRSVYTFWKRMAPPPNMEAFNAPSREVCTVRRERTNTPLQALVVLNDPQFVEAARRLAEAAIQSCDSETGPERRLEYISTRLLARELEAREQAVVLADLQGYRTHYLDHPADAAALLAVGESPADASLPPAELASWTMVCNQLMNLDEAINK